MEQEKVHPATNVSFAPTESFVKAFPSELASQQAQFTQPTWAARMEQPANNPPTPLSVEMKPEFLPKNPLASAVAEVSRKRTERPKPPSLDCEDPYNPPEGTPVVTLVVGGMVFLFTFLGVFFAVRELRSYLASGGGT